MNSALSTETDAGQYDTGTSSVRVVRVGNVIQIVFSNPLEAKFLYDEIAEKYRQAEKTIRVCEFSRSRKRQANCSFTG